MKVQQKVIPDGIVYVDYDTEYTEQTSLTTSQFYLKNSFLRNKSALKFFDDLLAVRKVKGMVKVLVFDDRAIKADLPYCKALSARLLGINKLLGFGENTKQMILCTFFSNAQLAA